MAKGSNSITGAQAHRITHGKGLGVRFPDYSRIDIAEVSLSQIKPVITAGGVTRGCGRALGIEDQAG